MELQRLREVEEEQKQMQLQQQQQNHERFHSESIFDSLNGGGHYHQSKKAIAIGQFDLTSAANTKRGSKLLLHTNGDVHPSNDCRKKVIEKYNKHWVMVLNSNDAVEGCDLSMLVRKSVNIAIKVDDDANMKGGIDVEMRRLVNSVIASTSISTSANGGKGNSNGTGDGDIHYDNPANGDDHFYYGDNVLFEELSLQNVNAYSGQISLSESNVGAMDEAVRILL